MLIEALQISDYIKVVVTALKEIADIRPVWPGGLMHPGGPHYRLAGMFKPISIGEDECLVFNQLIRTFRPEHCFIIGNAFGFSSAYIAGIMMQHGGKRVVTLDNLNDGDGERCAQIASQLAKRLNLSILRDKRGGSPKDIPLAADATAYQLVFIDGKHVHPQVVLDLESILPYTLENTIFIWHDFWVPGVSRGVQHAQERGFHCLWLPTSCEMVLGVRYTCTFNRLVNSFPNGKTLLPRSPRLRAYKTGGHAFLTFLLETLFKITPY